MRVFAFLVLICVCCSSTIYGQLVSDDERTQAQKLIKSYEQISSKLDRFAVLSDVVVSVEDFKKHDAFAYDCKFVQVVDRTISLQRYEAVVPAISASHKVSFLVNQTAIVDGKDVSWFLNGRLLRGPKHDKKDDKYRPRIVAFDAFALPIFGSACFIESESLENANRRLTDFLTTEITGFQEVDSRRVVVEVKTSNKANHLFTQLFFDCVTGSPIAARYLIRGIDPDDKSNSNKVREGDLSDVKTNWGLFESVPVPLSVTAVQFMGPSDNLSKKVTRQIELKWSKLPDVTPGASGIFSQDMTCDDIVEFVRSNAGSKPPNNVEQVVR